MDEATSYDYVEAVNPSLECAICRTAFISPVMSPVCQHIFCHLCVARAIELSPTCPIDRSPLQLEDLIQAPRIIQQLVEELKVVCPNNDRGCEVQCERGLLEGHLRDECSGRQREDVKGKGKAVASDAAGDASEREEDEWLRCELCQEKLRIIELEAHSSSCSSSPTTCPHCDTTLIRSSLPSHNLDCPSIPIPCPHAHHGCPARLPRSAMLEDHIEVSCAYEPIKDYLNRQEARLVEVEGENKLLATRCSTLEEGMKEMRGMLEAIRQGMGGFYVEPRRELLMEDSPSVRNVPSTRRQDDVPLDGDSWPTEDVSSPSAERPSAFAPPPPPTADAHLSPHLPSPLVSAHPHEHRLSPTSPTEHFPFPPPTSSPPLPSTPSQQPLSAVLSSLQASIASLSTSITALEARQSTNLMNETLRMQDDVQSVRAVVHGMRMQMHYLLMEVGRVTGGGGAGVGAGARGGLGGGAGVHPSSSDSVESTSDDEQSHGGPMMGMGMGMGVGGGGGPGYFSQGGPPQRYFLPGGGPPMRGGGGGVGPLLYPMGGMKL